MKDLEKLTAAEARRLLNERQISSEELTSACLARISERNPMVGAWCSLNEELSLKQAREADRSEPRSPLHGIPFGVKDVIDTAEFPTELGSPIHRGRRPRADAACVVAMRKAGAVLLGKLVTTEFATYKPNETRHPLNLAHTPGGSSSGTAAAIVDSHVPLGFGTQTAGSLIRPAAFCGVFALKPTHGVTDQRGIFPLEPFFDTLGYMARSIEDLRAVFEVVVGSKEVFEWPVERQPKIGLCRTHQWQHAGPESRFLLEECAHQLSRRGCRITEFELPGEFRELPETHRILLNKGIADSLGPDYRRAGEQMSPRLRSMIEEGLNTPDDSYRARRAMAERWRDAINMILGDYDALISPSTPGEAPPGMATGDPIFQIAWTLLGVPAMNLPLGTGPSRLPVGIQLVGKRFADAQLLALAGYLAQKLTQVSMLSAVVTSRS